MWCDGGDQDALEAQFLSAIVVQAGPPGKPQVCVCVLPLSLSRCARGRTATARVTLCYCSLLQICFGMRVTYTDAGQPCCSERLGDWTVNASGACPAQSLRQRCVQPR